MKIHSIFLAGCIGILTPLALGVGTSNWSQTSEAEWKTGQFDNVVATNLGDLKLSRAVKTLLEEDEDVSAVNCLAEGTDGTIYAGTGPKGVLLRVKGDDVSKLATIDDATAILSLCVDKAGGLLIGTGGKAGRVLRLEHPNKEGEKPVELFKADGVQYVWQIVQTPDGVIYAATGPTGKLYEIKTDGTQKVLLDTDENNLTALISNGKGLLYVGSDPNGLIYRVNRKTGESFVLYDAAESEISALALDAKGNLYAATAEAKEEGPPPPAEAGAADQGGRPEGGAAGIPITAEPPKEPAPPKLPNPNPGQPAPIPKAPVGEKESSSVMEWRQGGSGVMEWWSGGVRSRSAGNSNESLVALLGSMNKRSFQRSSLTGGLSDFPTPLPHVPTTPLLPATGQHAFTPLLPAVLSDQDDPAPAPGAKPRPPHVPGPPGAKPPTSQPADQSQQPAGPGRQPTVEAQPAEPRPEGNAVYKIDPEGFVTEVFRQPVLVLAMVEDHGTLLIATGNEGQIYEVNPTAGETAVLAKVEPKDVLSLLPAKDGRIYLGLANVGGIAAMSPGFAAKGNYTSQVFDATQISRFGKIHLHGSLAEGTSLKISTRSGNVRDPAGKGWSDWTEDVAAAEFLQVKSPSARFLQYRLTLASEDGKQTPVVEDINVAYQMPNLPPAVKSVKIAPAPDANAAAAGTSGDADAPRIPSTRREIIAWDASDPNSDPLQYSIYFRMGQDAPWVLLKDKLTDPTYEWDTRTVADGRYQIKVVASDALANVPGKGLTASRVSDPVLVDNTPPVIGDLKSEQHGADIKVSFRVVDHTGVVAAGDYSVDSSKDWQAILPSDNIWDGPEETAAFTIAGLSPGSHQVTIRATDSSGNQAFESLLIKVESPAASK
jgi:hypothetical protein